MTTRMDNPQHARTTTAHDMVPTMLRSPWARKFALQGDSDAYKTKSRASEGTG